MYLSTWIILFVKLQLQASLMVSKLHEISFVKEEDSDCWIMIAFLWQGVYSIPQFLYYVYVLTHSRNSTSDWFRLVWLKHSRKYYSFNSPHTNILKLNSDLFQQNEAIDF
jgi:hypothetical protein